MCSAIACINSGGTLYPIRAQRAAANFIVCRFSGASGCEAQLAEGSRYDLTVPGMMVQYVAAAALFCDSAVERGIGVTVPPRRELAFR